MESGTTGDTSRPQSNTARLAQLDKGPRPDADAGLATRCEKGVLLPFKQICHYASRG